MRHVTVVMFVLLAAIGCEENICDEDPGNSACREETDAGQLPPGPDGTNGSAEGSVDDARPNNAEAGATTDSGPARDAAPAPGDGGGADSRPPPDAGPSLDQGSPPNDTGQEPDALPRTHDAASPIRDAEQLPPDAAPDAVLPPDATPSGTPFQVVYTPPGPNANLDRVRMHLSCHNTMGAALVGDRHGDPIEVEADNVGNDRLVFIGEIPNGQSIDRCRGNIYDQARDLWVLRCNGPDSPVCELIEEGILELRIGETPATRCDATVPLNELHWWECASDRNLAQDRGE